MAAEKKLNGDPYGFPIEFERAVVTMACCRPKFYGRTVHAVDPTLLGDPAAKLALETCRAIAVDLKRGPETWFLVIQRLARMRYEGKVTQEQVAAVGKMFEAAEDAGLPTEESVETELLPVLRRRIEKQVAEAAIDAYGKQKDFSPVGELLQHRDQLGRNDTSIGLTLGEPSFAAMREINQVTRLPTGVMELDTHLEGGVPRGQLLVWVGSSGGGKSLAMSHSTAHGVRNGLNVAYATLELPEAIVAARVQSNLTGLPINAILQNADAQKRAGKLLSRIPKLGRFWVKEFTPRGSTLADIREWMKAVEDDLGSTVDKLIVDYADKLVVGGHDKNKSDYHVQGAVYEDLRVYATEKKFAAETGSQSRRKDSRNKKASKIDLDDVADSMGKVRTADIVVTLNYDDENNEMGFFIAKHRIGASRQMIGPLPVDFSCGQISPVLRKFEDEPVQVVVDQALKNAENIVVAEARAALDREPGSDG